jgi:hypothetical protein
MYKKYIKVDLHDFFVIIQALDIITLVINTQKMLIHERIKVFS